MDHTLDHGVNSLLSNLSQTEFLYIRDVFDLKVCFILKETVTFIEVWKVCDKIVGNYSRHRFTLSKCKRKQYFLFYVFILKMPGAMI